MADTTFVEAEREKISRLIRITSAAAQSCEVRGVYKIAEDTPAGRKASYEERVVGELPLEFLYGGCILVCPGGDRTNGETYIEIDSRSDTIRVARANRESMKSDGNRLQLNLEKEKMAFKLQKIYKAELGCEFVVLLD